MKITASSGNYQKIDSGLIIADKWDSDIIFHITDEKDFNYDVILKFKEDESGKQEFSRTIEKSKNTTIFECVNFRDTTGTKRPIQVVALEEKKVYITFRNYGEKNVMRKVEYTFYLGE